MTAQAKKDMFEKAKFLGNIGMFIMSSVFAIIGWQWNDSRNKSERELYELKMDVKQLLRNDAATQNAIEGINKRVDRNENRIDQIITAGS